MADLTATIITYNEEENIQACLESLTWVKEIVVVDSGSSDRTVEICRDYTDKVCINPWPGHQEQKNVAISLASHEWILSIDADERVPVELREAIERELSVPRHAGYRITRRNYFLGRWMRHGGWYPDRVLRLFDRRKGRFGGLNPHDRVVIADGSIDLLDGYLVHLTYRDFSRYIQKQDWYTGISAEGRVRGGHRARSITGIELALRALVKFVQVYLVKRGFLDGTHGLIAAVGAAHFNFMKYAKVWELGLRAKPGQGTERRQERWLDRHSAPAITPLVGQDERTVGISALAITLNEEENIRQCLESVSWADEIVVVDAGSDDGTVNVAKAAGALVWSKDWTGFGAQKNFAFDQATGEWLLVIDADERVSAALADEILALQKAGTLSACTAYDVPRRNYFFGRWLRWGGAYPDRQIRLIRRGKGRYNDLPLHEHLLVDGTVGHLSGHLIHEAGRTVTDRVAKLNRYSDSVATETLVKCKRVAWWDLVFRPAVVFVKLYILKQGFRDGLHGLVYAGLASLYTFARYVKAWELSGYPRCSG
ncbi:MAG: glycosyltransferase family 2 protein [candidate division NC10 bacterium]|nr:glycosyltransferase family 2 protein [candidate division NC10 bacterium]MDE2322826.1 glycosyltransferase family 2 protein [candidate division NC10 bacterium]